MTPLLVRLALGSKPSGWVPIVVDQTDVHGTQVILAGIHVANRILPVAFACFAYSQIRKSKRSGTVPAFTHSGLPASRL